MSSGNRYRYTNKRRQGAGLGMRRSECMAGGGRVRRQRVGAASACPVAVDAPVADFPRAVALRGRVSVPSVLF